MGAGSTSENKTEMIIKFAGWLERQTLNELSHLYLFQEHAKHAAAFGAFVFAVVLA